MRLEDDRDDVADHYNFTAQKQRPMRRASQIITSVLQARATEAATQKYPTYLHNTQPLAELPHGSLRQVLTCGDTGCTASGKVQLQ